MSAPPTTTAGASWHSIRPPPPAYPAELMLSGQTVKVTVSGKGPSNEQPRSFTVSRALLCAHSEYFDRVCGWKEGTGEPLVTEMPDVQPWVFGVFLTFAFEQRLRKIDMPVHDLASPARDATGVGQTVREGSHYEDGLVDIIPRIYHEELGDGEEDQMDPTTWNFTALFEMYIFGDRYAGHLFRQSVFEAIQVRVWLTIKKQPLVCLWLWWDPKAGAITYALHCLPNTSPLRRYLIERSVTHGIAFQQSTDPAATMHYTKSLENYPQDALAEILIKMSRAIACKKCQKCNPKEVGSLINGDCDAVDHEKGDHIDPDLRGRCHFHEHKTQDEKGLCKMRVQALRGKIHPELSLRADLS